MSEKVFTLGEVEVAFEMYTKLLLLSEGDQARADNIKSGFLAMLGNGAFNILNATQAQMDKLKDSIYEFQAFIKLKKEKREEDSSGVIDNTDHKFSITGATSMTRDPTSIINQRKKKETRSEPPKKTEGGIDRMILKKIHEDLFDSCDKKPFEADKKYRVVGEHEVRAIQSIDKVLDFKKCDYPVRLNFVERKYGRINYCSSELVNRMPVKEDTLDFDPKDTSEGGIKRYKSGINMAGRVLKSCKFAGTKHYIEETVCKKLFFTDNENLTNGKFKVNLNTYFRHPSISTPDILFMKNDSAELVVIEVKSVEGKTMNTSTVKRQVANAMYVMNAKMGFIVSWGKYRSYRRNDMLMKAVKFPVEARLREVYAKLYPKEKRAGQHGDLTLLELDKLCVSVETSEGIIHIEKIDVNDKAYKKLGVLLDRGLNDYREILRFIGARGFSDSGKGCETFRTIANSGCLDPENNFNKGTMEDLGLDETISVLYAKAVVSQKLLSLACRQTMLKDADMLTACKLIAKLDMMLTLVGEDQFDTPNNIKVIEKSMELAHKAIESAEDENSYMPGKEDSVSAYIDEDDDTESDSDESDEDENQQIPHAIHQTGKTTQKTPEKKSEEALSKVILEFVQKSPEIFQPEELPNHASDKQRHPTGNPGLLSIMKADTGKLESLVNSPGKYKIVHPNQMMRSTGVLGKRKVDYSLSKTGDIESEVEIPVDSPTPPRRRPARRSGQDETDSSEVRRIIDERLKTLSAGIRAAPVSLRRDSPGNKRNVGVKGETTREKSTKPERKKLHK